MFKRKDWVFLRKGQGGEASSSSEDSEDLSSSLTSESEEGASTEEEETTDQTSSQEDIQVHLSDEDLSAEENLATLEDQIEEWCNSREKGNTVKGRALTCMICTGKKLLLNSDMFLKHVASSKHKKNAASSKLLDKDELAKLFCFADQSDTEKPQQDVETHAERLERVKNASLEKRSIISSTPRDEKKKKRKTRPGKRQRQQIKAQIKN